MQILRIEVSQSNTANVAIEVEYLEWGLNQRFLIQNNHMCHKNPDLLDIYAICALFTVDFRWC